jgi:glyoxylase-like metal-dependent hydrolase (beta-lactamase superfamily II)
MIRERTLFASSAVHATPMASSSSNETAVESQVTAEGESLPSDPRKIRYVDVDAPKSGELVEIAPNICWARIPLPIDLNHINVWLIDIGHHYVVVDTGMTPQMCKGAWEQLEQHVLKHKPIGGIFITHAHPDHIGLAQWLQERYSVDAWMSEDTLNLARAVYVERAPRAEDTETFLRTHGVVEIDALKPMFAPERFSRMSSGLPRVERFVADDDVLQWGPTAWQALRTDGHAEGHLCLYEAARNVLISGDQVLPTISSNISVMLQQRDQNPLHSYLQSLDRLRQLRADTLVLPSHGKPFIGLRARIDDLQEHHQEQLTKLLDACATPKTAYELLPIMFRRELAGMHFFLALGEAVAHLEYLAQSHKLERVVAAGVTRYLNPA